MASIRPLASNYSEGTCRGKYVKPSSIRKGARCFGTPAGNGNRSPGSQKPEPVLGRKTWQSPESCATGSMAEIAIGHEDACRPSIGKRLSSLDRTLAVPQESCGVNATRRFELGGIRGHVIAASDSKPSGACWRKRRQVLWPKGRNPPLTRRCCRRVDQCKLLGLRASNAP